MKESSRQERIIRTSLIGILVNLLIAAVKIVIGTLASSIAIVSEGINNATDAGSSFLTYVGTKHFRETSGMKSIHLDMEELSI